ncbi:MAG: hypothetical protein L3K17_03395 [Thermoplasmata archaeon]|nr:hypothetical protein [Thermoplasmata archaeon]
MAATDAHRALAARALVLLRREAAPGATTRELIEQLRAATRWSGSSAELKLATHVSRFIAALEVGQGERAAALLPRIGRAAEYAYDWD